MLRVNKMNEEKRVQAGVVSSIDIIEKTGISRATLNNYIKMNLLPRPHVRKPEKSPVRARMLGYFPDSVIDTIGQIKALKQQGSAMNVIIERLKRSDLIKPSGEGTMREASRTPDIYGTGKFLRSGPTDYRIIPEETRHPLENPSPRRKNNINELHRHLMPAFASFCVLVADLQNSVRICAELPPDEYFELINRIWVCAEGSFKRYNAAHGKHPGNGMLYYFPKDRDKRYMINAILCALELRDIIKQINTEWKVRKGWFNELQLNIGINEGEEYFGTITASPGAELTTLGDTVNHAGRLSDFSRCGAIWTTKNLINKLCDDERERIRYGIRHIDKEHEVVVESTFCRIVDIMTPDTVKNSRFMDIATLAITEILGRR